MTLCFARSTRAMSRVGGLSKAVAKLYPTRGNLPGPDRDICFFDSMGGGAWPCLRVWLVAETRL